MQMNGTIGDGEPEPDASGLAISSATHAIKGFEDFRELCKGNP
jgi:hypothetical protein